MTRDIVYTNFKNMEASWFYNTIYVNGLNNTNKKFDDKDKELLHSKLFKGVFLKAIAYIYDTTKSKNIYIDVISDTIDKGIIKKFTKSIDESIKFLTNKNVEKKSTSFDKNNKEIIHYKYSTTVEYDTSMVIFDSIKYNINCEDTSVTFIADILVNSTHFYLNKAVKKNINIALNSKEAIKEHPLSNLVYGCTQNGTEYTMDFMDIMYRR